MEAKNKISVFLVDDNEVFLKTLIFFLNEQFKSEIQIESFSTGEDCLKKIQQNPEAATDIVILDYHLNTESNNAMNGIDILKKIKNINSKIIVVMLSAEDKLKIATDCITNGAYEYVVKSETAFIRTQNILKNSLEKEFNSKILKTTMMIMEKYPELSKYIEEMDETIPDEKDPQVTLKNLKSYYDSLDSMLKKYILEHPAIEPHLV
ncbi:MAG: response regulator [Bacteroidia bacterium]